MEKRKERESAVGARYMERSGENYRFQAQRTHSRSASWSLQRNHNANDVTSGFAQRLGPIRNALAFAGLGRLTPPERSASPDATATDVAEDMPTSAPVTTTRAHQRGASGNVFFASPSPSYASNASTFNLETGIQIDATGSGERAETQARNNGRHGNNNNNNANDDDNSNSAEFQVAMRWLQRIVPFALLFGVKLLWDHGLGIDEKRMRTLVIYSSSLSLSRRFGSGRSVCHVCQCE